MNLIKNYKLKKIFLVLFALTVSAAILLFTNLGIKNTTAQTAGDLAFNKPVITISSTAAGSNPANAVDGNPTTYWTSGSGGAQWLGIDLGTTTSIGTVNVKWGTNSATDYDIELSNDGIGYTVVWNGINGDFSNNINGTGRYILIRTRTGSNPANYQLASLEVYTAPIPTPAPTPTPTPTPIPTPTPTPTATPVVTPSPTPTPSSTTIFENSFEGGIVNNNFVGWDGTTLEGAGSITAEPVIKTDGQYSALFNAPNGSTLSPVDRAFSYKQFIFPAGNILWAKTKFRFEGAGTSIQFGGGFLMQFNTNSGYYSNRWNVEFYSPSQVFDRPNNTAYPFTINGTADAGTPRIHQNDHTFVEPDTWYEVKMKIDYSGINPMASYWLNGVYQNSLTDTSVLSVNATKPTFVHVGIPWWDQATREKLYIDQVGLYSADPDASLPVPTATPIPPAPTPTPSPTPVPCTLTSASWNVPGSTSLITTQGNKVNLSASGNTACTNQAVTFTVVRNGASITGGNDVSFQPNPQVVNIASGSATTTWTAEFNPLIPYTSPQYYFTAQVTGGNTIDTTANLLTVTKAAPTPIPIPTDPNDWAQVQKDPQHTGYSSETLGTNIQIAWRHPFQPDKVFPQVQAIIYRGKALVGTEGANGQKPTLYALNAQNGSEVWRFEAGGPILNSVAADNGKAYFGSMDGVVYAVYTDIENGHTAGQLAWKQQIISNRGFSTAPVYADNKIMLGGRDGYFYALNPNDGSVIWKYNIGVPLLQTAAWNNGKVYFGAMDMHVYALNSSPTDPNNPATILAWKSNIPLVGYILKDYWPVVTQGRVLERTTINWSDTTNFYSIDENTGIVSTTNLPQFIQSINGAVNPPCVDRTNQLVVPIANVAPDDWQGVWGRLNLSTGAITRLPVPAGNHNQDENMDVSCSNNLLLTIHTEEENAQYTGAYNLDNNTWIPIYRGAMNMQMSANTQGGGGNPASISNGMFYHITYYELVARTTN